MVGCLNRFIIKCKGAVRTPRPSFFRRQHQEERKALSRRRGQVKHERNLTMRLRRRDFAAGRVRPNGNAGRERSFSRSADGIGPVNFVQHIMDWAGAKIAVQYCDAVHCGAGRFASLQSPFRFGVFDRTQVGVNHAQPRIVANADIARYSNGNQQTNDRDDDDQLDEGKARGCTPPKFHTVARYLAVSVPRA
jgi:hypothetical protein